MEKVFRGKKLCIRVENKEHKESGCTSLLVNGQKMEGNYIPENVLKEENEILLVM